MNTLTQEQIEHIERRSEELTDLALPGNRTHRYPIRTEAQSREWEARYHAKLEDLPLHMESLRLLCEVAHSFDCHKCDDRMILTDDGCTCGLDAHIATLEELLGIKKEQP